MNSHVCYDRFWSHRQFYQLSLPPFLLRTQYCVVQVLPVLSRHGRWKAENSLAPMPDATQDSGAPRTPVPRFDNPPQLPHYPWNPLAQATRPLDSLVQSSNHVQLSALSHEVSSKQTLDYLRTASIPTPPTVPSSLLPFEPFVSPTRSTPRPRTQRP